MSDFWIKEAIDILRQNGSREPADAVEAIAARLADIATIAHDGGLQSSSEVAALNAIRRLTLTHWNKVGDETERRVRVAIAFGAADSASVGESS